MELLRKNRPFFIFLLKFGLTYFILSALYWLYLSQFDAANNEADSMTKTVAYQTQGVVEFFGIDAFTRPRFTENSYRFYINGKSMGRIVEGCNAISVMILFTSFIIAFSSTLKRTALYIVSGIIAMHVLNIIRLAVLFISFYYLPDYKDFMHDIFFPLFIYGVVFILWILWITKFSGHGKKAKA